MVRPRSDGFERPTSGMRVSPSSRDKGRMWGRVGAWCLSLWLFDSLGFHEARWSHPDEDKHQAHSSTPPRPLSLQDAGRTFPDSIVKHHQDVGAASTSMDMITRFGRQSSSGEHSEQDAGDRKGPPRRSSPPSPLRNLMGFSLA